ncbi:hypothetical protein ACQ4M3_03510 [Leptolyngbya sp. AN03gr2]|uniref:hypothetical protein n=1 Tax=unclassified Leptolyngbya TaxID=2650499 RepID=UPI003D321843
MTTRIMDWVQTGLDDGTTPRKYYKSSMHLKHALAQVTRKSDRASVREALVSART